MHNTIRATAEPMRISGLTLTPSVSSSKNRNSPALAAGIGDELFFFFLLIYEVLHLALTRTAFSIINVMLLQKSFYF